ncbi:sensor domain-containing diguanylate cyclase [Vibrio bivalvicida]|uniref:diguanylate cyclase n=1 Tax=Vibrio bivalvicida TaxID=1276888 RepID=A0A177XZ80_9VIBR|nr:sensor domain-containing diguanylate cyclase [Vibrio bivalvicida]OAJ93904.1 diguanylate cyclase [Vibrio bivalvicida]
MQVNRHFSLKFVFLMPLAIAIIVLALTVKNYYDSVNRDIDDEYERIHAALSRSAKVISALDYSFSNSSKSNYILLVEHNRQVKGELCQMWPIDAALLSDGRDQEIPAVDINYMLVGDASLCDPHSDNYQRVSDQVSLAPILSFLHDIDTYLLGIHYIDKEGYIMSSPDTYAKSITLELLNTLKVRPFWHQTAHNRDLVTLTGPAPIATTSDLVMSLSMPVFNNGVHQGMLSVDIAYDELLDSQGTLAGNLSIIDSARISPPQNAFRLETIDIDGVVGEHSLYYLLDLPKEIGNFFSFERYSLIVTLFIYVFSVIVLFFINTRIEHGYFKELAAKDPMTGLLNRRGLEDFLQGRANASCAVLSVLDIDDFKAINDTYGHDVGDRVITYMAETISLSIRDSDAAARIGGEEFVIYLSGNNIEALKNSINRVHQAICSQAHQAVEGGFTVSGGVEVIQGNTPCSFDKLFKAADEKLYQAKTSGKNKLVF